MRIELGAPIVLVAGVDALWHLPAGEPRGGAHDPTLCGLSGDTFIYAGVVRRRRGCSVCLRHRDAPRLHRRLEGEPEPLPLVHADRDYDGRPREWPPRAQHASRWVE